MAMTSQELMAILLPTLGNGIISGINSSQQRGQQLQQQLQDNVQRQMMALQNAQQTSQNLQDNRQNMAQAGLNASPLGQEQSYVQRNRLMQAMLPMVAGFQPAGPSDPGIAGAIRQGTNPLTMFGDPRLQETFSDQMTGQALADRRRALAGVNPDFEFASLGTYGMDPSLDQGVARAQDAAGRRLSAYEGAQASLAQQQIDLARQQQQQQQSGQQQNRGGGVSGFLGGLLRTAAPFAGLIPGVGPGLALGLGAAGSALGTRLQGGSMMDSIIAGGTTAGMGALANRAQTGSWSGRTPQGPQLNNQMSAASLPLPSMPVGGQGPQLQPQTNFSIPQPYNASGDVMRQIQGLNPQTPTSPTQNRPTVNPVSRPPQPPAQGMNPQFGYPMRDALPYSGPPQRLPGQGPQGQLPQIGRGLPGATAMAGFAESLRQQPFVQVMQSPFGAMVGGGVASAMPRAAAMAGGALVPTGPQAMGSPLPSLRTGFRGPIPGTGGPVSQPQLGQGQRLLTGQQGLPSGPQPAGLLRGVQPQLPPSNLDQNYQNILNVLSGNNGMTPEQKAQFLAQPQVQEILQRIIRGF